MLWEERDMFLSLFTVMQSMELPELSTEADLDHLKVCLLFTPEVCRFNSFSFCGTYRNRVWTPFTCWMLVLAVALPILGPTLLGVVLVDISTK